jgi:hypothetical protein
MQFATPIEFVNFCRNRRKAFSQQAFKIALIFETAGSDQLTHIPNRYRGG